MFSDPVEQLFDFFPLRLTSRFTLENFLIYFSLLTALAARDAVIIQTVWTA